MGMATTGLTVIIMLISLASFLSVVLPNKPKSVPVTSTSSPERVTRWHRDKTLAPTCFWLAYLDHAGPIELCRTRKLALPPAIQTPHSRRSYYFSMSMHSVRLCMQYALPEKRLTVLIDWLIEEFIRRKLQRIMYSFMTIQIRWYKVN